MDKVRCFLVFVCLFIVHVLSVQQVNQAKGLKRDAILGINYANFVVDMFHYLNVGKVGSALVTKLSECTFKCLKEVSCFSFNLAASPDGDGKLWCELLATDKYNASDKFQVNESSHHYSIYVRCFSICFSFAGVKNGSVFATFCFFRLELNWLLLCIILVSTLEESV